MYPASNIFVTGHCYYNIKEDDESPKVMLCRKSIIYGMQLVPYSGLFKFPISCESEEVRAGSWVDCTEQVKRSEAMKNCEGCPLVPISKEHIGTVIAFQDDGKMSSPHFLYAYSNGMAFLMELDGGSRVFNLRISQCYPLQRIYKDIAERAVTTDPLRSSIFDGFMGWLRKTSQYNAFTSIVYRSPSTETQEDMIRLFELLSFEGVTAATFESEVDKRYAELPESAKDFESKYAAVLSSLDSPVKHYSRVEKEIMRATDFQYKTPQEAWAAEGGGKPFPKTVAQVVIEDPPTPQQYICDHIGLYDGNATGFWFAVICPALGDFPDFETGYKAAVGRYLKMYPSFDEGQLSFIAEEDKEAVFKRLLKTDHLDAEDPFRAWIKNPPESFRAYRRENPQLSYVEVFKAIYSMSST